MVRLLIVIACGVVALAVLVRILEPRLAFFPDRGERPTPADLGIPFKPATLQTADGERLRAWDLPAPNPRAVVVYFHGNGGNLSVWLPILDGVRRHGFTVAAIDYRGYGASTGTPSERGLYRDVDATLEWAWGLAQPGIPVVYWGRSLGTTMAAYGATRRAPDGVILEAGFPNARALTRESPALAVLGLFSTYRFPTADYAKSVRCPILVMHGDADRVIPFSHGRALYEALAGRKRFVAIPGGDHNDMAPPNPDAYWKAVDEFIAALDVRKTART
jgi:uncharacterized protein